MNAPVRTVNITRKEKEYRGMLEFRQGDESRLLKNVVIGMLIMFCSSKSFSELFLELHVNVSRGYTVEDTVFVDCALKFRNLLRSEASWCSSQPHSRASGLHHLHVPTIC